MVVVVANPADEVLSVVATVVGTNNFVNHVFLCAILGDNGTRLGEHFLPLLL